MEKVAAVVKAAVVKHSMKNYSEDLHTLADLGAVYLLLGPACNMTCRHCTQTPIKNCFDLSPQGKKLSQDVKDFIVKWNGSPWKYGENNPRRFYFWGGEPLLYWETIKKLVLEFESMGVKGLSYRIFSNGLLINDEIVEFCNTHDIWFIMSYDAPNPTAARNTVPSDVACEKFLQIHKRNVNTVFNAINDDMVAAFMWLKAKFPNTFISCGFMNVLSEHTPKDLYNFKAGRVRKAVKDLHALMFEDKELGRYINRWFDSKYWRVNRWDKDEFLEYPLPPCHPGMVSISVNFKGDVVLCHNTDKVVGHITDDFSVLQEKHNSFFKELLPSKCLECEHLDICRCICPIAVKQDGELCYCDYLREFWSAVKECCKPKQFEVQAGKSYKLKMVNGEIVLQEVIQDGDRAGAINH